MISVDVNGNTLTNAYDDAITQDSRTFLAKLLINGVELDGAIQRIEITKGSCGDGTEFDVGNVIGYSLTAKLLGLTDVVKGQIIEAQIGLLTDAEHETYTWVKMGEFIVSEAKKALYSTTITAHGRIVAETGRLLDPINNIVTDDGEIITVSRGELLAYPPIIQSQTLAALAVKIAYRLGCSVSFDVGIDTSLVINQPLTGMTIYQVIQIMAACIGGYATDTVDGNIKFCRFSDTATVECNSGQMTALPQVSEQDFTITGIRCIVTESSIQTDGSTIPATGYSQGSPVNMTVNSEYETEELFASMCYLIGYTYRPGVIELSLGDPRIEGTDVLEVTDADGSQYIIPGHIVKHTYDGGFSTHIEAVPATNIENKVGTLTPFQRLVKETRRDIVQVREAVEDVKNISGNTAQHFWMVEEGTDTGAHITEITKEEFLEDPDNAGGNMLIRSNGMAVRDGLTELASFGSDGVIIGQAEQSRVQVTYHAMKMIDYDGNVFLHISDLRDAQGKYQATESFTGDGTTVSFTLAWSDITASSVSVDGVATTDYTITETGGRSTLTFTTAPANNASIVCIYETESSELKAYTLGHRGSGTVGGYSVAEGCDNIASGKHAQARGHECKALGDYAQAIGDNAKAAGNNSIAAGYQVEAYGEYLTVLGIYNKSGRPNAGENDYLLVIGNGSQLGRSDALKLDKKGNLEVSSVKQVATGTNAQALSTDAITFINALVAKQFTRDNETDIGLLATEVETADTWGCLTGDGTVDYAKIIAPLIKYCQELEARITALGG